jgi:RNase H-fold protein (predicted Holliday junction resolvase)
MPECEEAETLLAVDPGRAKCGIAVVSGPSPVRILSHTVVDAQRLTLESANLRRRFPEITRIIVGDGTGSSVLRRALTEMFFDLPVESVPEHGTSAQARTRFLAENPAPGWRRILPPGLRAPERAYDDYVAVILAEAFFSKKK